MPVLDSWYHRKDLSQQHRSRSESIDFSARIHSSEQEWASEKSLGPEEAKHHSLDVVFTGREELFELAQKFTPVGDKSPFCWRGGVVVLTWIFVEQLWCPDPTAGVEWACQNHNVNETIISYNRVRVTFSCLGYSIVHTVPGMP